MSGQTFPSVSISSESESPSFKHGEIPSLSSYFKFPPTEQQASFILALLYSENHLTLQARAGCGKTSSILMGVDAYAKVHSTHDVWVCAYNKAIEVEISAKLKLLGYNFPKYVSSTVHAAGFGLVKFVYGSHNIKLQVDDHKVRNLIDARIQSRGKDSDVYFQFKAQISSLVSYAKQAGVGFFDDCQIGDTGVWYRLADHFDVNGIDDTSTMDDVVTCAQEIYRASLDQTNVIDFDDMILFPLVKNIRVKFVKDLIFVDEAQDLSRARQALIRKFLKPHTGRLVIVGDEFQSIYGFTGADSESMVNLTASLSATVLPLSVTWRCPKAVVQLAQSIVPDIQAADLAPEGTVERLGSLDEVIEPALTPGKEEDAVLCRNTAPLVDLAYSLIRRGIPAKVEGRKIGEGLKDLCRRWKVGTTSGLIERLENYRDREVQKALAKGSEQKASEVEDKVQTLMQIISEVNRQGKNRTEDVISFIDALFADGADKVVTLCTYHRAKGREWNRVILFEHAGRCPSKYARQSWQKKQEANLAYVAFTRAKKNLIFIG